jgi:glucan biosynthesis protein C
MTETPPPVGYIMGLDTWRAALMLGGVVLHGSIGLPALGLFVAIDMISQTFRMGTFFGIAGILTAIALAKRAPGEWLRRRLVRLGFPLAFGLFILSPFIWLMRTAAGDIAPTDTPFNWYHLWFLAALIAYSTIIYASIRLRLDEALETYFVDLIARKTVRSSTVLLFTAVTSATLFGIAPRIMAATMSDSTFATFRMLQLAAGYLPMFLLGYLVGRVPALKSLLLHQTRTATMIAVAITSSYMIWFALIALYANSAIVASGTADLRFVAAAIGPPAAFVLILRSALRVRSVPALVQRVSAASYTIYVLHLPLVVAINLALFPGPLRRRPYRRQNMTSMSHNDCSGTCRIRSRKSGTYDAIIDAILGQPPIQALGRNNDRRNCSEPPLPARHQAGPCRPADIRPRDDDRAQAIGHCAAERVRPTRHPAHALAHRWLPRQDEGG